MTNEQMQQRITDLEQRLNRFEHLERFMFYKKIQMQDGMKVQLGNTTGMYLGTAATQKLGFYGKTPVIQPSTNTTTGGHFTVGGTAINDQDNFDGDLGGTKYTLQSVVRNLKNLGLLAS